MNESDKTCLFFGAWSPSKIGHFLYASDGMRSVAIHWMDCNKLDAGFLGKSREQPQGEYVRAMHLGWVVLSFWDRTGDDRFGSNSAFLFDYDAPDAELLEHARQQFPTIFARFTFSLKPRVEAIA